MDWHTTKATKSTKLAKEVRAIFLRELRLPSHLVGSKLRRAKPEASATAGELRGEKVPLELSRRAHFGMH